MAKSILKNEEFWNTTTHGIGVLLSITALIILIIAGSYSDLSLSLFSGLFFGISLLTLYTASTLYHAFKKETIKNKLRIFDHISIYYLIAGTYTPFALITLRDSLGWWIFGAVWVLAFIGTLFKIFYTGRFEIISVLTYIGMGWMVIIDFSYLIETIDQLALIFLIIGGGFYTLGTIFYSFNKIPFNHAIWHVFVLGGSIFHFFSVMQII